jgi:hypothetical protein
MIPLSDYANPRFIRYKVGATLSRNDNARFSCMSYGGRAWRNQPQPGYSASNPRITPLRINLNVDNLTLPPSVR